MTFVINLQIIENPAFQRSYNNESGFSDQSLMLNSPERLQGNSELKYVLLFCSTVHSLCNLNTVSIICALSNSKRCFILNWKFKYCLSCYMLL